MVKLAVAGFLCILITVGISAAGGPDAVDYLPLGSGRANEYRCVLIIDGQARVKEWAMVRQYPAGQFPGKDLIMRRYDYTGEVNNLDPKDRFYRYADQLSFEYLGRNQQGVYLYARQHQGVKTPFIFPQPEFLLKNPVEAGAAWDGKDGKYRLASVTETLTTPAGNFTGCVRVDLTPAEGQAVTSFWYAPGSGLVQWRRTFPKGEETWQLLSLKK